MDQPALEGGGGGLGAVCDAELTENVIDMTLDCGFADAEAGADFFIALASHNQLQHFHFPTGQVGAGHSLGQPLGDRCRNVSRSSVYRPNRGFELLEEDVL